MPLILCGFFCAGKTTLGRGTSKRLSLPFIDTDRLIEERYGKGISVAEIWLEIGMQAFRDLESEVVGSLTAEPAIIATGGGTLLREENLLKLKEIGNLCYLKASLPTLYSRMVLRGFPAFLDKQRPFEHFQELAQNRLPIFETHCPTHLETEGAREEELLKKLAFIYAQ